MVELTAKHLREVLSYDQNTGQFTRRKTGAPAGHRRSDGYILIRVGTPRYYAHRLAWFYVHGEWPANDLDHINLEPSDNRIANLREATMSQNMHNTARPPHNTSGFKGVCFDKVNRKWMAYIHVSGKFKNLGRFPSKEEARTAYDTAALRLFGDYALPNMEVHSVSNN